MTPKVKSVAETLQRKARIIKIDSDESPKASSKLQVRSLPTFIAFNKGAEIGRIIGMTSEEQLVEIIESQDQDTSDAPYIWTQAGIEYLQQNGFHAMMKWPAA